MYAFKTKIVLIPRTDGIWNDGEKEQKIYYKLSESDIRNLFESMNKASSAIFEGTDGEIILCPEYLKADTHISNVVRLKNGLMSPIPFKEIYSPFRNGGGHLFDWIIYYWKSGGITPAAALTGAQHYSITKDYGLTWIPAIDSSAGHWELDRVIVHEWLHLYQDCLSRKTDIDRDKLYSPHDSIEKIKNKLGRKVNHPKNALEDLNICTQVSKAAGVDNPWCYIAYRHKFIRHFLICGPFSLSHRLTSLSIDSLRKDLDDVVGFEFHSGHNRHKGNFRDAILLQNAFRTSETHYKKVYLSTIIFSANSRELSLRFSGNGPVECWLNKKTQFVLEDDNSTVLLYNRHEQKLHLNEGNNHLIISVGQTKCWWNIWLELSDDYGRAIDDIEIYPHE